MKRSRQQTSLPIDPLLPELRRALTMHRCVVLSAEPGAGKTTRVPLALLEESWLAGRRMIMLEPRRLAALRAADFMAEQIGEEPGETVGYRIRGESRVGSRTRIEVVTEGILTRMLQTDPALPGVALVIFDEFHERSIHADLGLALTLDVQAHLREDLRILVMSATLDGVKVASLMGDCPVLKSEGAMFPVTTHYLEHIDEGPVEPIVVSTIMRVLHREKGDVLVFLPGQQEIRRVESRLVGTGLSEDVVVHLLFGDAPKEQQWKALAAPPPGRRKVILSTSVAETSLTIDGVRIVVDSGLARTTRFDPRRGMSGLVTVPVSQASADQRRGRAGRQAPGVCYRLWTEPQHARLPRFPQPEILIADLASTALELARWGDPEAHRLKFLDSPPIAHLSQARGLLMDLGALDAAGRLTSHGRAMSELPVHPRLAHMLLRGKELGLGALACDVAALLEERDLLRGERGADVDLRSRWHLLKITRGGDRFARERAVAQATRLRRLLGVPEEKLPEDKLGLLLALAYPERVAKQRERGSGRYQLAGGTGAVLPRGSLLAREPFLAVGEVDGLGSETRVYLAAPMSEEEIYEVFSDRIVDSDEVYWDSQHHAVVARRVSRLGGLRLSEVPLKPPKETLRAVVCEGIRQLGLDELPWSKEAASLRTRSEWLRSRGFVGPGWPDLSDRHLLDALDGWLGPYLDRVTRRAHLQELDTGKSIRRLFTHDQLRRLDYLAPTHWVVPTGSRIPLDYSQGQDPVLAVRLQEMFGETDTPTVADGQAPVLLHLLSPAHRPLAVTRDLRSFWKNAYPGVRKEMRGRYPKHSWPENPLEAAPTRHTTRKSARH